MGRSRDDLGHWKVVDDLDDDRVDEAVRGRFEASTSRFGPSLVGTRRGRSASPSGRTLRIPRLKKRAGGERRV